MFASRALAARIEGCEARLGTSVARGAAGVEHAGRAVVPIAGGVSAFVRPGSINKVIGVGFAGVPDDGALAEIEAFWWAQGERVRFEISTLADPEIFKMLGARGYQLLEFENVLGLALPAAGVGPAQGADVTVVTDELIPSWYEAMLDGFAVPDGSDAAAPMPREVLESVFADFLQAEWGQRRYLATVEGAAAGAATARFDDGVAQLCGASTVPQLRRRGVQRALLARRLEDAAREGCEVAVVTTAPGSQSQANVMKLGFGLLYARAVLVKPPPDAAA